MPYPGKGRADHLELGTWNVRCNFCGFKFKASELQRHWTGVYVCRTCFEIRQPQDFVRAVPDIQTPPWVQPTPEAIFAGPTLIETSEAMSVNSVTFTPAVNYTAPASPSASSQTSPYYYLLVTSTNPDTGPFPIQQNLVSGTPVTLTLAASFGRLAWT